ncbi:MAG TPA: glycosyltransferase [Candidatus Scalindua sp.]|nr:glycosyltransferase [Candidatus Scalindua sp.]
MKSVPSISIVIPTLNSERTLQECLNSIANQDYPKDKMEVIVIDNYSSDNTVEIAKKFTARVYNKGPERSAQRNFGVEKAKGKYILYLDADMTLSKTVVEECVNKCENENYIALYIPERISGEKFWSKVRNFERSFYNATVIDCVRFIKRDKFLDIGGFDLSLTGPEDWDFDRRIKTTGKADIIDAPLYHNEGEFNLKEYLPKKGYYIRTLANYIKKWGRDDPVIRKQLGPWYRLFGVFIENKKWRRLLKHPLLTSGIYFLRLAVGLVYLKRR